MRLLDYCKWVGTCLVLLGLELSCSLAIDDCYTATGSAMVLQSITSKQALAISSNHQFRFWMELACQQRKRHIQSRFEFTWLLRGTPNNGNEVWRKRKTL